MIGHMCSHGHVTGRSHLITCVLTVTCASDEQVRHKLLAKHTSTSLNNDQQHVFDNIVASISAQDGRSFFVHGPRGTGKTFLYSAVCHHIRGNGWITLCVASSGIAALLLP